MKAEQMINYIENGQSYVSRSCGITTVGNEITKEEYDRLSALPHSEFDEMIQEETPAHIFQGYGYYGSKLIENEGRYFACREQGSSCE